VVLGGGKIYVGGFFSIIAGTTRYHVAAFEQANGTITNWDPIADDYVSALAADGDRVYAAGGFSNIGGQPRKSLAALVAAGALAGQATAWNPGVSTFVWDHPSLVSLAVIGGTVYAGGGFLSCGGVFHPNSAAIDADQSLVSVGDDPEASEDRLTVGPNPTLAVAQVHYAVARGGRVRLELLDVSGRVVETLVDRLHVPGHYDVTCGAPPRRARLAAGLYIVRLTTPDQVTVRKLAMLR